MSDANITVEVDAASIENLIQQIELSLNRTAVAIGGGAVAPSQLSQKKVMAAWIAHSMSSGGNPAIQAYLRSNNFAANIFGTSKLSNAGLKNFASFMNQNQALLASPQGFFKGLMTQFQNLKIPTINRNLRTILRQFPGGAALSQGMFGVKRLQKATISGGMEGLIGIAATLLIVFQTINSMKRQIDAQNQYYKNIFTEYKTDLSNEEFKKLQGQSTDNWGKFMSFIFRSY